MKNITLSADEALIESARRQARAEHTTLNEAFRRWLTSYARRDRHADDAMALIDELSGSVRTGGKTFNRDEMDVR